MRPCASLEEAMLCTTSPKLFGPERIEGYERTERAVRLARYGTDCYAYCMLAAGHVDLVIEDGLKPHDILPLVPILEGAGAIVTTWDGGAPNAGGAILASGDPRLHEAALECLNRRA